MHSITLLSFYFSESTYYHDLHSFPTRRSSDLGHTQLEARAFRRPLSEQATGRRASFAHLEHFDHHRQRAWIDRAEDRKSTRLNSSHLGISYAVFCLKKKKFITIQTKIDLKSKI